MKKSTNKKLTITAVVILLIGAGAGAVYLANSDDENSGYQTGDQSNQPNRNGDAKSDDTKTDDDAGSDQPESTRSESGNITVYQPLPNSKIKSGFIISGTAKADTISYRLIDDVMGVVVTGSSPVNSGRFSEKLEFSSQGREGRLDIFRTLSDGREVDVVEIPVRLR